MDTLALRNYFLGLQERIVSAAGELDGQPFLTDAWQRPAGGKLEGDGITRLIENGNVLERGGCNFSNVKGQA